MSADKSEEITKDSIEPIPIRFFESRKANPEKDQIDIQEPLHIVPDTNKPHYLQSGLDGDREKMLKELRETIREIKKGSQALSDPREVSVHERKTVYPVPYNGSEIATNVVERDAEEEVPDPGKRLREFSGMDASEKADASVDKDADISEELSKDSIGPTPFRIFGRKQEEPETDRVELEESPRRKSGVDSIEDLKGGVDKDRDRVLGELRKRIREMKDDASATNKQAEVAIDGNDTLYPISFKESERAPGQAEQKELGESDTEKRLRELSGLKAIEQYDGSDIGLDVNPDEEIESIVSNTEDVMAVDQADQLLYDALDDVIDKNYKVAIPKLEQVIDLDPGLGAAWESLGWCYYRTGSPEKTRMLWTRLRLLDPSRPLAFNLLAKLATAENDLPKAIDYYNRSLDIDADQYNVRYDLARIMRWEGSLDISIEMLRNVLKDDPNRTDVVLDLARALTDDWKYAEALPLWQRLRNIAPDNSEFKEGEARCLLHTGSVDLSLEMAENLFESDPDNMVALMISANIAQTSENPEYAIPYLERMMELKSDPQEKEEIRARLLRLYIKLHDKHPDRFGLDEALELARDSLEYDQKSVDARLTMAELLLLQGEYREAEVVFSYVLARANPYNLRARKGMFETQLAMRKFKEAHNQLVGIAEFNPYDIYLYYYIYRWKSAQGDFFGAFEALDKLERAGESGAVPVFLYHGLTGSKHFMDALSVDTFREQIETLKKAGFRFMKSSDIPDYFSQRDHYGEGILLADRDVMVPPERVVVINFDDARRDSMAYATPIAQQERVVFSMHIPTGYVDMRHPFICTWEQLEEYDQTGVWDFGSHFKDAAILTAIDSDGRLGHALANRIWLRDKGRFETMREYEDRLKVESAESRRILRDHLSGPVNFVSYPFGDIGQEVNTNVRRPVRAIIESVRSDYDIGFIQSPYGFAVNGDDPMLYQRHEMDRFASGEDVLEHIYMNHPVYLAQRERAKLAALQGRRVKAMKVVEVLEMASYPDRMLDELRDYIYEKLAGKIDVAEAIEGGDTILGIPIRHPYLGLEGEYFSDNQDRTRERLAAYGGIEIFTRLALEGLVGEGRLEQDVIAEDGSGAKRNIEVDESDIGLRGALRLTDANYLRGELIQRDFASTSNDYRKLMYALEGHLRPMLACDAMLRYEDDAVPSALAVDQEIESKALIGNAVYKVNDYWDITAALMNYDFSDDNTRDHYSLGTSWLLNERTGFRAGAGFSYVSADKDTQAYWSPYEMSRFFVEAGYQGSYLRKYYNLRLRLGAGRESVRPEEEAAYEQQVARAQALNFDPGPPPAEDWETVIGVSASTRVPIRNNWTLNGEVSYNKLPNYDSFNVGAGVRYEF